MIVQTDGGRYDIDISNRLRTAVYWEEPPSPVRRLVNTIEEALPLLINNDINYN